MKLFNKHIKIFVIASFAFMQTSNAFATIFSLSSNNFIQICTAKGIKLVSIDSIKDPKKSLVKAKLMNCCLDVQSNFIIDSYVFVEPNNLLSFYKNKNINLLKSSNFNNINSIRAPPLVV